MEAHLPLGRWHTPPTAGTRCVNNGVAWCRGPPQSPPGTFAPGEASRRPHVPGVSYNVPRYLAGMGSG